MPIPLISLILLLFLTSCGQQNPPDEPPPERERIESSPSLTHEGTMDFEHLHKTLFRPNCSECHNPEGQAFVNFLVPLNFESEQSSYLTLTRERVENVNPSPCRDLPFVEQGQPHQSYLMAVLSPAYYTHDFAGVRGCSPYRGHHQDLGLKEKEIQAIGDWISRGANP